MGKAFHHHMIFMLLFYPICHIFIHPQTVVAVRICWTHSASASYNDKAVGRLILHDNDIDNDRNSVNQLDSSGAIAIESLRGGAYLLPAGWNPMGYKITALGEQFLSLGDSLECDVGRFIASLKASRKRLSTIKDSWLEIVRASKKGQAMRIYRSIDELIDFCIKTGLID